MIRHGEFARSSYTACLSAGSLLAMMYFGWQAERQRLDLRKIAIAQILILLTGLLGSRLLELLLDPSMYAGPLSTVAFWLPGGRVYYGGFLLASASAIAYFRVVGLPIAQCCDNAAPGVAIGLACGRIGCFLSGCCLERVWTLSWCFPYSGENGGPWLSRHPTQLYELFGVLALLLFLHWYHGRPGRPAGAVMVAFLYLYSALRFVIEFFRGDDREASILGMFSPSQWIGLILIVVGATVHRRILKEGRGSGLAPARAA